MLDFQQYDTHICLISEQAAPNYLPLVTPGTKPSRAVLLVSKAMFKVGQDLARSLPGDIEKDLRKIRNYGEKDYIDINNLEKLRAFFSRLIELERQNGHRVVFNLTGGTKLMAIAAALACYINNCPAFYVDVDTCRIQNVNGNDADDGSYPDLRLSLQGNLSGYLGAYGLRVLPEEAHAFPASGLAYVRALLALENDDRELCPKMHGLAMKGRDQGEKSPHDEIVVACHDVIDSRLMIPLENLGLAVRHPEALAFPNEAARFYVAGGWLEHYVYESLQGMIPGLRNNCKIQDPKTHQTNEFDTVFFYRNTLYIVECKARRFEDREDANGVLYKMAAIMRKLGHKTHGILVSYWDLPETARLRAEDSKFNIDVIQGAELMNLRQRLARILDIDNSIPGELVRP